MSTDVQQTLRDIFSLGATPFIHEFLFDTNEASHHISHDGADSLSALVRVTAQETIPIRYGRIFDHSVNINFRSTPAVNVGGMALGFCTLHYLDGDGSRRVHTRYARDDVRGQLFVVAAPQLDVMEMDVVTFHSARRRTRVNARFKAQMLRDAFRAGEMHGAVNALFTISTSRQWRACPVCRRDGAVNMVDGSGDRNNFV